MIQVIRTDGNVVFVTFRREVEAPESATTRDLLDLAAAILARLTIKNTDLE